RKIRFGIFRQPHGIGLRLLDWITQQLHCITEKLRLETAPTLEIDETTPLWPPCLERILDIVPGWPSLRVERRFCPYFGSKLTFSLRPCCDQCGFDQGLQPALLRFQPVFQSEQPPGCDPLLFRPFGRKFDELPAQLGLWKKVMDERHVAAEFKLRDRVQP